MTMRIFIGSALLCLFFVSGNASAVDAVESITVAQAPIAMEAPPVPPPMGGEMLFRSRAMPVPGMMDMGFGGPPMGPVMIAGNFGGPMVAHFGFPLFGPELDLTDDQLEAIHKKRNEFLAKEDSLQAEMRTIERSIMDAMTQPNLDKDQIRQLQSKANNLHAQIASLATEHMLSVSDVLTTEQRKKLRQMVIKVPMPPGPQPHHGRPEQDHATP